MRRALLTIDDSPTEFTSELLAHLACRNIHAVFFCIGERLDRHPGTTDGILRGGHAIGNHSWSHRRFSEIGLPECRAEIDRTEEAIEQAYRRNGAIRRRKHFRFPYGDKGGPHRAELQTELVHRGFVNVSGLVIGYPWYSETSLDRDRDAYWTFDCLDYRLTSGTQRLSPDDILAHLGDPSPDMGGSLAAGTSDEIILMHDNPNTNTVFPTYHERLIDTILAKGFEFVEP